MAKEEEQVKNNQKEDETESKKDSANKTDEPKEAPIKQKPTVPLLLDAAITVAQIVVLLVGVLTTMFSLMEGAHIWIAALRGAVAVFMVGLMFWFANWFLGKHALEVAYAHIKKEMEEEKVESTIERTA